MPSTAKSYFKASLSLLHFLVYDYHQGWWGGRRAIKTGEDISIRVHARLCAQSLSRVQLFATPWTAVRQAPRPWDSPGKNTGVGCHFQGIFPAQGSNPHLLHCRQLLYRWARGTTPRLAVPSSLTVLVHILMYINLSTGSVRNDWSQLLFSFCFRKMDYFPFNKIWTWWPLIFAKTICFWQYWWNDSSLSKLMKPLAVHACLLWLQCPLVDTFLTSFSLLIICRK